jgi:hypothetical protein
MPDQSNFTLPPYPTPPDLTQFNETTRRALYDHVRRVVWEEPFIEEGLSAEMIPRHAADYFEMEVFQCYGRWMAAWRNDKVNTELHPYLRYEVVRIKADPEGPGGLMLHEV